MNSRLELFRYDDAIVRKFMVATLVWGLVGMIVGLVIALQLAVPALNAGPWLSFGRLRPLHTNVVIFADAIVGTFERGDHRHDPVHRRVPSTP